MTGVLLTFFWLPIVWRHGWMKLMRTAFDLILNEQAAFTNQPWDLLNFLTFSNVTVTAIITGIIVLVFIRKKFYWDFQRLMLVVWIVVALVLMQSYLFKPIMWVDRYYQFFDIALILCAGVFLSLLIDRANNIKKVKFKYKGFLLLLLIYPLYNAVDVDYTFGRWGYQSDIRMLEYMQYLPPGSLVAAPSGVNGLWVPALSGVNILGGWPSQLVEHRYLGDDDSDLIINSPDVNKKMELIRKYGVNYIFIPIHSRINMVWNPSLDKEGIEGFNNQTYFEIRRVITDTYGSTALVKVKEKLQPKYNIEKIDWSVTIAGYFISFFSLLIFVYLLNDPRPY